MRINSITAQDVMSVRRFEVSELSDIVVLAGPNGVGKPLRHRVLCLNLL
jgi:predicted ATPase